MRAKAALNGNSTKEWKRGELLQFQTVDEMREHFIRRDCRALSSGGLLEIRKYFSKHMQIEICVDEDEFNQLHEIHVRRHLHVHNDGRVDAEYIRFFGNAYSPGQRLEVDELYLKGAINLLSKVAEHTSNDAATKFQAERAIWQDGPRDAGYPDEIAYFFRGAFSSSDFASEYFEGANRIADESSIAAELLVGARIEGRNAYWTIVGEGYELGTYFKQLRRIEASGDLKLLESVRLSPKVKN